VHLLIRHWKPENPRQQAADLLYQQQKRVSKQEAKPVVVVANIAANCDNLKKKTKCLIYRLHTKNSMILSLWTLVNEFIPIKNSYLSIWVPQNLLHVSAASSLLFSWRLEKTSIAVSFQVGMPADYVNKLARMFQDIKVSEDLNQQFKETKKGKVAGNGYFAWRLSNSWPWTLFWAKAWKLLFLIVNVFALLFVEYAVWCHAVAFRTDMANIKILNSGAWSRRMDRIPVSLPPALEDLIPDVEEFYKTKHTGRKLQWNHLMSNGVVS